MSVRFGSQDFSNFRIASNFALIRFCYLDLKIVIRRGLAIGFGDWLSCI